MSNKISMYDTAAMTREIQQYLRILSLYEGIEPMVAPDGIYGAETAQAVRDFQSKNGLCPTGNTDLETFNMLYNKASKYTDFAQNPGVIIPLPCADYKTFAGETGDFIYIIQIILNALTIDYDFPVSIKINGIYDSETQSAIRHFQKLHGLPETGMVDRDTWENLSNEYNYYQAFRNPNQ